MLLGCHLFYAGGAWAMHAYASYRADRFYNEQAAKGLYNVAELTEVIIPVNLQNIEDWKSYENVSGHIQFGEHSYNYVKMKLTRKAMYLMCVPNYDKTQLLEQNVISAKGVKHVPVSPKAHVPQFKLATMAGYQFSFNRFAFEAPVKELNVKLSQPVQQASGRSLDIPEQPPQL